MSIYNIYIFIWSWCKIPASFKHVFTKLYFFVFSLFQPACWPERKLGRSAFRLSPVRFVVALSVILDDVFICYPVRISGEKVKVVLVHDVKPRGGMKGVDRSLTSTLDWGEKVDFAPATVGASWSLESKFRLSSCVCAYFVVLGMQQQRQPVYSSLRIWQATFHLVSDQNTG